MVEKGIIAALIALAILAVLPTIAAKVQGEFSQVAAGFHLGPAVQTTESH